jgi:uncharacterized repeat protein (TIGR02543 family)
MKTNVLNNENPFSRSVIAVCSFLLLTGLLFFHTGCSSNDDGPEVYTVTFETDGGTPVPATQKVEKGSLVIAPSANPAKAGYVFVYWHISGATAAYNFQTPVNGDITLYAYWTTGGGTDNGSAQTFTSISELKSWLTTQPANTVETAYKIGLKNVNLDSGNNWNDLGVSVNNGSKYVELNLQGCNGTAIPDGRMESKHEGGKVIFTTYGTFVGCNNLTAITLPDNLKTIGKYSFVECQNLLSVALPETATEIHYQAFDQCVKLGSINLPEGLKVIDAYAFRNTALVSVNIPESVTSLGGMAFQDCASLRTVTVQAKIETLEEWIFKGCASLESIVLPESLKAIGNDAFNGCKSMETITLPSGITSLGNFAFNGCSNLSSIVLPDGIRKIGQSAFTRCKSLTSVVLPANLERIEFYAFYDCESLNTPIEIPSKVVQIESYAFAGTAITTYIMRPVSPPQLSLSSLSSFPLPASFIIKVPPASVNIYKQSAGRYGEDWKAYADRVIANTD